MMSLRRRTVLLLSLLLLAGCSAAPKAVPPAPAPAAGTSGGAAAPSEPAQPERWFPVVGAQAVEVAGTDVLSKEHLSLSALKGQVVYLNFWATWCGPCKEEMPALNQLAGELKGKVHFLAFDADANEDPAVIAKYADDMKLTLPLVWDEGKAARTYFVSGIPMSIVIGRDGKIAAKKLGAATRQQMLDLIATADKTAA